MSDITKYLASVILPIDEYEGELTNIKDMFNARLQKYGITQHQAQLLLGLQKRTLEGILDRSAIRVDALNLLKLSQFLGLRDSDFWALYIGELGIEEIKELQDTRRSTFIVQNFDISALRKSGVIRTVNDFNEIENSITRFLGIKEIFDYSGSKYIPAFSKTKRSPNELMREFWVRSAIKQFELLSNPNSYDRENLKELIPKIRPYTRNVENGIKTVVQALYQAGITVIYQPHITGTQVRGATFVVNNKPCIAITDLNKNYATIWFALLHELHHVLYDLEDIEKQVFHLTGEIDLFLLQEETANDFAREYLFSKEKSKYIYKHINNDFLVAEFAKENQVHPSIIYSFYTYDKKEEGKNYYAFFSKYYPPVYHALKDLTDGNTFEDSTIEKSVKYLKENIFNS